MSRYIVVTGLDQLRTSERWPRLVAPLAEELGESGLGSLPELDALRREHDQTGVLQATEVAVSLVHFDHGRALVDRVVEAAGVQCEKAALPMRWRDFGSADYFSSELAKHGYWDEPGQYWYIVSADQVYEDDERQFLVIGGPGVDGIDWGYRRGHTGLWAWYPIEARFVPLAPTAQALLQGWLSGAITV
ncbi:MAG: hypothetical protein U0840_02745 [Gemmataceae bacterium]